MPREDRDIGREERERERDLVLNPRQYAYILDLTKGHINVYVGPHKTSLANTDRPVRFSRASRRFEECRLEDAIQEFVSVDEGAYVVLENPAMDDKEAHANPGSNAVAKLNYGRKVHIAGPISFSLWPGQVGQVIPGHHLRSNQYLLGRVYNEDAARANWSRAVIKPAVPQGETEPGAAGAVVGLEAGAPALVTGQLLIIKGTEVGFYIPPTGIEVVPDENGSYTRDAVTLERLEYCVLLDENGNKRYVRGPAVVFPRPTETFVKREGSAKFRAIELNELSGLYVKVIASYEEAGKSYREGEELFLTGRDQMIYFPRPEHSLIRYSGQEIHYAVAIPAGEARYVLDKVTGQIGLVKGPQMFLPDPRKQVIVRRVLGRRLVDLLYPGNTEAQEYNRMLSELATRQQGSGFVLERTVQKAKGGPPASAPAPAPSAAAQASVPGAQAQSLAQAWELESAGASPAAELERQTAYTQPPTVTLHTKYDGAISSNVWTGYAVLLVSKSGSRRVVVGPQTALLEYDESPQILELSTGTPKTDKTIQTVFLRVVNNKVSDLVQAVTKDLVDVAIRLSYRVNFEGEPERWFNVENYVNFLCDHTRSLIRNAAKQHGIDEFNQNVISIVRDTILGKPDKDGKRTGRRFEENGMRVYDVEVLDVTIGDAVIGKMLVESQHQAVHQAILLAQRERELPDTRRTEAIAQEIDAIQAETKNRRRALEARAHEDDLKVKLAAALTEIHVAAERLNGQQAQQDALARIHGAELERDRTARTQNLAMAERRQQLEAARLEAEARAVAARASAITPQLVAALQGFGDKVFVERLMQALGPHALLRGNTLADVFAQLVNGTPELGGKLQELLGTAKDGGAAPPA
jgi:major vault protein